MSQVKPIEQIETGNVNVKTGEEEDEIYDSIYMKIVELVEKDNISCGFYKDTANKLKDLYVIEKRSEQQDTPDQSSQIKLLQEQIRKQEEEVCRLRGEVKNVVHELLHSTACSWITEDGIAMIQTIEGNFLSEDDWIKEALNQK